MERIIDPKAPIWRAASPMDSGISLIWCSRASARALVAAPATGAHTSRHTGTVRSTQSERLQASRAPGAGMKSVTVSSHRSATVKA